MPMIECPFHEDQMEPTTVITKEEDLQNYFDAGARPRDRWGVGLEYERFGVIRESGDPLPYEGPISVERLLRELVQEPKIDVL